MIAKCFSDAVGQKLIDVKIFDSVNFYEYPLWWTVYYFDRCILIAQVSYTCDNEEDVYQLITEVSEFMPSILIEILNIETPANQTTG